LLLTRLLTPTDFGIVAIAVTLVQILETVFDLPISQLLIRSPVLNTELLNTAFTLGLLRGAVLALLLAACAWPFARIYHDPRLIPLILVLSLASVMRGLASPAMAHFARAIDFRRNVILEVSSKLASLALTAALGFTVLHNYWAIVVGTVTTPTVSALLSFVVAPHKPRLSLAAWREFASFLGWFTLVQLMSAINWKAGRLILGDVAPRAVLGNFSMAGDLCAMPYQALISPVMGPLMAGFSHVQNEPERLARAYGRSVATIIAVGLPVMLALVVLAKPIVRLLLGAKWQFTPQPLSWLALAGCIGLAGAPFGSLCMATGRAKSIFWINLAELVVSLPVTVFFIILRGLPGAIAAQFVVVISNQLVIMGLVTRIIPRGVFAQLRPMLRPILAASLYALVLWALRPITTTLERPMLALALILIGAAGLTVYIAALLTLWAFAGRPDGLEQTIVKTAKASMVAITGKFRPRR
jgi:O-antigen/teichoic acid export membrane protein